MQVKNGNLNVNIYYNDYNDNDDDFDDGNFITLKASNGFKNALKSFKPLTPYFLRFPYLNISKDFE